MKQLRYTRWILYAALFILGGLVVAYTSGTPGLGKHASLITDKMGLWELRRGPHLRGANVYQRRVYRELDEPDVMGSGPLGPPYAQEDFEQLAALGANYVNISHPGLFTEAAPYTLDQQVQKNLDSLLDMIAKANMFAVISFRTGPGRSEFTFNLNEVGDWFDESYVNERVWKGRGAQDAWADMWRYTGQCYRDNPVVVGYNLMVEPNAKAVWLDIGEPAEFYSKYAGTSYDWNQFYPRITAAIREVDRDTPILVGGMEFSAVRWLPYLQITGDARTVYGVHQYQPFNYTHQEPPLTKAYPGVFDTDLDGEDDQFDRSWLERLLETVDTFVATHNVPVAVNECGVSRWEPGAAEFMDDQMDLFEQRGMNYAVWLWETSWESYSAREDVFNFRHGPDPANHADVASSDLIKVILKYWGRNTIRPSDVTDVFVQRESTTELRRTGEKEDTDSGETLIKRRYLPTKNPETDPRVEDTLILYTENPGDSAYLEGAKLLKDLISSHWDVRVNMKPVDHYEKGEIDGFDVLVYLGAYYYTDIPQSLIDDVGNTSKEILWINYHIWALDTEKLGFAFRRIEDSGPAKLGYKGYDFEFDSTDVSVVDVVNPRQCEVLAWLGKDETGARIPAIVNANDSFLYVSFLPPAASWGDELVPFFDALHETFGHHERVAKALLRFEDIHPGWGNLDNLMNIKRFLKEKKVPYHLALIPVYVNPEKDVSISILDRPRFIRLLKSMELDDGDLVLHGYTHQYDGETTVDFEFWDESRNEPVEEDSEEFARQRVSSALDILQKAGLTTEIWETPHYKASDVDYGVFREFFPIIYDDRNAIGVPFTFRRSNTVFSPLDLSYVSSRESISQIVATAKRIYDCFEDPAVSVFYHTYLFVDPDLGESALHTIIDSLREIGYEFHSIYDLIERN